jgi:ssDNA-binding Zn-finger/Zn-ribbon topoisomerase 1
MTRINITCETCGKVHNVIRTSEIPDNVTSLGCNWCPDCEDRAEGYYEEWYNYDEGGNNPTPDPDPNQMNLFPIYPDERDFKEKEQQQTVTNKK